MVNSVLAMLGGDKEGEGDDFKFHKDVDADGEEHELDNKAGGYELVMASSNPTLLSDIPTRSPGGIPGLLGRHEAPKEQRPRPDARRPPTRSRGDRHGGDEQPAVPSSSATPVRRASGPSPRTRPSRSATQGPGIDVWEMESEHVIPRGFLDAALMALGL